MYSRSLSDDSVVAADRRWFKSLSTTNLKEYVSERATLKLESVPAQATVTVNTRSFPSDLTTIRSLNPAGIHMVTVDTTSSHPPVSIFFKASTEIPTTIRYDNHTSALSIKTSDGCTTNISASSTKLPSVGERGVAAIAAPAEYQWSMLTSCIDNYVLATAGIQPGTVVMGNDKNNSTDSYPSFAPLPRLGNTHTMSVNDLTNMSPDRSDFVCSLVKRRYAGEPNRLLGELQFAYICFAYLGSLDALNHYRSLLKEICNSYDLNKLFSGFVSKVSEVLNMQFSMMNQEAIRLTLTDDLRKDLVRFISTSWKQTTVLEFAKTLNGVMGTNTSSVSSGSDRSGSSGEISGSDEGSD